MSNRWWLMLFSLLFSRLGLILSTQIKWRFFEAHEQERTYDSMFKWWIASIASRHPQERNYAQQPHLCLFLGLTGQSSDAKHKHRQRDRRGRGHHTAWSCKRMKVCDIPEQTTWWSATSQMEGEEHPHHPHGHDKDASRRHQREENKSRGFIQTTITCLIDKHKILPWQGTQRRCTL